MRKRKASTDLQPSNAKESKVEIEVEYTNNRGHESSIPVKVDVSSSAPLGSVSLPAKKKTDVMPRIASGLALASGFFSTRYIISKARGYTDFAFYTSVLLLAGHIYMIILVLLIQSLVYREITQLFQGTRDPWSKTLNWYFFAVANYYLYGETIIYYFKVLPKVLILYSFKLIGNVACRFVRGCIPSIRRQPSFY